MGAGHGAKREGLQDAERRWLVGIDWASQEHVASLLDGRGRKIGQCQFAHDGAGVAEMIAWPLKASGGEPGEIHVEIETPHGPIVEALLERGFNVYSINPKRLDRFRDRFTVAGAKDDSLDADVLGDSPATGKVRTRLIHHDLTPMEEFGASPQTCGCSGSSRSPRAQGMGAH
jgi:Transposase